MHRPAKRYIAASINSLMVTVGITAMRISSPTMKSIARRLHRQRLVEALAGKLDGSLFIRQLS